MCLDLLAFSPSWPQILVRVYFVILCSYLLSIIRALLSYGLCYPSFLVHLYPCFACFRHSLSLLLSMALFLPAASQHHMLPGAWLLLLVTYCCTHLLLLFFFVLFRLMSWMTLVLLFIYLQQSSGPCDPRKATANWTNCLIFLWSRRCRCGWSGVAAEVYIIKGQELPGL